MASARRLLLQEEEENIFISVKPFNSEVYVHFHQGKFDKESKKKRLSLRSAECHGLTNKLGSLWSGVSSEVYIKSGEYPIVFEEGQAGNSTNFFTLLFFVFTEKIILVRLTTN